MEDALEDLKKAVASAVDLVPGLFPKQPHVSPGWLLTKGPMEKIISTLMEHRLPPKTSRTQLQEFEEHRKRVIQDIRRAWDRYRRLTDPEATVPVPRR